MDVDAFSLGQDARSKSPAPTHELAGHRPASAKRGGLLFGYFLLATQEKVARAPQECESFCSVPTIKSKSIAHKVRSYKKAKASRLKSLPQARA